MKVLDCKCSNWAREYTALWESHHHNCPGNRLRKDGNEVIERFVRAIEAWAADEDGVHPAAWDVYKFGKACIGEPVPADMEAAP